MGRSRHAGRAIALATLAALTALTGCGLPADGSQTSILGAQRSLGDAAVPAQGLPPLRGPVGVPDLLVVGAERLPDRLVARVRRAPGVARTVRLSVAQVPVGEQRVTVAAGDPRRLRAFTAAAVARADAVWARVASGEAFVAATSVTGETRRSGRLPLSAAPGGPAVGIAAFGALPPQIDAVTNAAWGRSLGIPRHNALLVDVAGSVEEIDAVAADLRRVGGARAGVVPLQASATGARTALLAGSAVSAVVGSFRYRPREDGTVSVDPAWVARNIRTEEVPILGRVTCHRVMLPQLRGALAEIERRGLAGAIDPGQYGGCFYPRFIGHDPARGLSLHSWGIAVDLNVSGNQRGTVGEIDRDVVAILKSWGFAWGGDWQYTDPMHFELAALVQPG